jgi:hypothetical protein
MKRVSLKALVLGLLAAGCGLAAVALAGVWYGDYVPDW